LDLFNQRAKLAVQIGREKANRNLEFYSPQREREIFERLSAKNPGPFPNDALRAAYREILSASLSLEKPLKVSFLGPRATFTHLACLEHFGRSGQLLPEKNIRDVFQAVERSRVDFGVIPIENSTEGVIAYHLDLFMECDVQISAEILMDISLDLLSRADALPDIRRVYSHPHALAQCRNWIENHLADAEILDVQSTAKASEIASAEPHSAAVASSFAGKLYDLNVLERNIQDHPFNYTRFLVIGRQDAERTGQDKTSLMFSLKDNIGALHEALKPFSDHHINLTKIESRPHKRKAWEYIFFVDIEGHRSDENVRQAMKGFFPVCNDVKMLGSYPRGRISLKEKTSPSLRSAAGKKHV
jgi:chorismate mutase / prephenate dehydratase